MIIKDVLHDVEVFFAHHASEDYLNLVAEPGLMFCDISPPPGRHQEFLDVGSIVLDHHIKTRAVVKEFETHGLGVYGESDNGESGATLAFQHVWSRLQYNAKTVYDDVSKLARLAGIRDTWQKDSPEWIDALVQTEALAFYGPERFLSSKHGARISASELELGALMRAQFQKIVDRTVNEAFVTTWENKKIALIPGHRTISDAAEALREKGVAITISFYYGVENGIPHMSMSARSDGSFDCNKFAGYYGGGGHKQAAGGIRIPVTKGLSNPYYTFEDMLQTHGRECLENK
jgi:oligoribonuclease NrnB/cAMP/cGMP phosphodiesterase (DHH superfamily)